MFAEIAFGVFAAFKRASLLLCVTYHHDAEK